MDHLKIDSFCPQSNRKKSCVKILCYVIKLNYYWIGLKGSPESDVINKF